MINYKKLTIGFGLLMTLIMPTFGLANDKTNSLPSALRAVDSKDDLLKYGRNALDYTNNCAEIVNQPKPSGSQIKRCLTIAKELRDSLPGFLGNTESITKKMRDDKKWNKDFDVLFSKEAAKSGVDSETLADIKKAGGFRAFYEKSIAEIKASKDDLDKEIKELESKVKDSASINNNSVFQKASFSPNAAFIPWKLIGKVLYKVAVAVITACELAGYC